MRSTIFTYVILGQVKNDITGAIKVKMVALEDKGVFLQITFELTKLEHNLPHHRDILIDTH